MPSDHVIENFLRERIRAALGSLDHVSIGSVEDETICLVEEGGEWVVGYGERGRFYPEARFRSDVAAAKYLILCALDRREGFAYPPTDFTGYASLPEA